MRTLFILTIVIIVTYSHAYQCVLFDQASTPFCRDIYESVGFNVYDVAFPPSTQAHQDNAAYNIYWSYLSNRTDVSNECKDATKKALCTAVLYSCEQFPTQPALQPCKSVCQKAVDACPPNFATIRNVCSASTDTNCYDVYAHGIFNCFGHLSNESSVCSGHGKCVGPNKCKCDDFYHGDKCQTSPPVCAAVPASMAPFCGELLSSIPGYVINTASYPYNELSSQDLQAEDAYGKYTEFQDKGTPECRAALKKILCIDAFPRCVEYPNDMDRMACPSLCDNAFTTCGTKFFKGRFPHDLCTSSSVKCTTGEPSSTLRKAHAVPNTSVLSARLNIGLLLTVVVMLILFM